MTNPFVAFVYGIIFLLFLSCSSDIEKINLMTEPNNLPLETGKQIEIIYTDSGMLRARITAPLLERYANETKNQTEMPKGIKVQFYDRNKNVESMLEAGSAIRYEKERKMVAKSNVVLINIKGDTLRTELLNWDEVNQKIHSNQFVRITTPDEIIMGTGFESNPEFTQYKIHQISGTISLRN